MSQSEIEKATKHRLSGRFTEAERIYRRLLAIEPNDPDALHGLGALAEQVGRPDMAADLIGQAIRRRPSNATFHNDLGKALIRLGRREEAANCFQKAVELNPLDPEAHSNLGNTFSDNAKYEEAVAAYRRAIELRPEYVEAHFNLGNAFKRQGHFPQAIEAYETAIKLRPTLSEARNNLGQVLMDIGKLEEAIDSFKKVIELRPGQAMGYNNLGSALRKTGKLEPALEALNKAISLQPDYAIAFSNRGLILKDFGRHEAALDSFRKAVALKPDFPEGLNNLTTQLKELGRYQEVIQVCNQAIRNRPNYAEAYNVLGGLLQELGQVDEAFRVCSRAIAIKPDLAEAHNNLGNIFRDQGRLDKAIESYRHALKIKPEAFSIHSNLAYTLHFATGYNAADILAENRRWADQHEKPLLAKAPPHSNDRSANRKLRIGYVCPYFRVHCAAFFMLPVLENHDPSKVEIFCYSGTKKPDHVTQKFKNLNHTWRESASATDAELAEQIRNDKVDILIDIALHMSDSRLPTFARKPAPVQVTWLGYPGTTGLSSIDYRLTDPFLDSPGEGDEFYSEKSIRLPHSFWCYHPLIETPEVNTLPALKAGYVTFGCFNNFHKVTPETLQLWIQGMRGIPNSRLIILSQPGKHREAVLETFAQGGIAKERIEFVARIPLDEYFRLYHRVDLCLDTIPYPGHTTTLDSLWMGVPVITLTGQTAVSRGGLSILSNLNLQELIAKTPEEYAAIVHKTAADLDSLARLRADLRQRMRSSPLMNAKQFAADLENAYRDMWTKYCAGAS